MSHLPVPSAESLSYEISTIDDANPRSAVNLVPREIGKDIRDALFQHPEYFDKEERELWKYLRTQESTPSPTDNRLRLKFWMEYDRVQGLGLKSMNMTNVLAGVCGKEYFYSNYMTKANKVAWLLCPPTGYMVKCEEALEFGIEQLRDILDQAHVLANGKVDTKLGELKAKIVLALDTRVKGAPIQRSMNLHVSTSEAAVAKAAQASSAEELMKELKELERRNRVAQNLPTPAGGKPDIEIS